MKNTRSFRRRWTTIPACAAALALLLASCASADTPGSGRAESSAHLLPAAEGSTEYPLTLTSALGEIVIPERPERVVMATSWDADLFAALGVSPVGTDDQVTFYPWAVEAYPSEIETVWPVGDVQYPAEQIAATAPELIVDSFAVDAESVAQLGDIAPVLGAPEEAGDSATWQERILLLGEALDLSERAQKVVDDYDAAFLALRSEHPEFDGKTVDYVVHWGEAGTGFINTAGSDAEALFTDLGFAPSSNAANASFEEVLSDELLGTLTGDVLLISNQVEDAEFQEFYSNPLIQGLESVKNGRVLVLTLDQDDFTVTHDGDPTGFVGHFGRAFSVGPLSKVEIAELVSPLLSVELQ